MPGFFVHKLVDWVLLPGTMLVLLAAAGLALSHTRWRRAGTIALSLGVGGLLACLVLPVDTWLIQPLEERFPAPAEPTHVDGIIVLSGGINELLSADRGVPTLSSSGERVTGFVALARRWPEARLVFAGGSGKPFAGGATEAEWAGRLFEELGLPRERVAFENTSRTTEENAVFVQRLVRPQSGETWLVVTSAAHMPRAIGVFRHAGWRVQAWPVGYRSMRGDLLRRWDTLGAKLRVLDQAAHEWIGLVAYWAAGRTDTLFPGPDRQDMAKAVEIPQ